MEHNNDIPLVQTTPLHKQNTKIEIIAGTLPDDDIDESANDADESANDIDESANDKDESANDVDESTNDVDESANDVDESTNDVDESTNDKDESSNDADESVNDIDESTKNDYLSQYDDLTRARIERLKKYQFKKGKQWHHLNGRRGSNLWRRLLEVGAWRSPQTVRENLKKYYPDYADQIDNFDNVHLAFAQFWLAAGRGREWALKELISLTTSRYVRMTFTKEGEELGVNLSVKVPPEISTKP